MSTQWNSDLLIFSDVNGQQYVSIALPVGAIPADAVRHYKASGPYMPISFPEPYPVDDANEWLREHQAKGFTFTIQI